MKLSELVGYRQHLEELTNDIQRDLLHREVDPVLYAVAHAPLLEPRHTDLLRISRDNMQQAMANFMHNLDTIKAEIDDIIRQEQPAYLLRSYGLYQDMCRGDTVDYILDRRIQVTNQTHDFVEARIRRRDTWKHPAMIIRPGREVWIDTMVAFDPLYVVDHDAGLLAPARGRFNQLYQTRVRWIVAREQEDHAILQAIPDDQIGFCLAWNFFHYKPFEVIKQYLQEIFVKLRPGGVVAFSFNDCDRSGGVDNAERMWMCFTPGSMIQALAESLGFDTVYRHEIDRSVTWLELQKPGERVSLRGGQSLAKVIDKPQMVKVDIPQQKTYTNEQIEMLIQQALDLNIDTEHALRHAYRPQKLEKIISKRKPK